ncbi:MULTISPECIES: hypothetical protein [unclassified Marinobacter]|uniref:hypothetical protein n=1 Tax=unclassified Marinobacter TaxID=83889 RepID=UPI00273CB827|nr:MULTISPECIES: hypothetical protein [unclassified Marinobacter]MDP4546539.1 hypothetical protein [Marinobacter sp. MDS2]
MKKKRNLRTALGLAALLTAGMAPAVLAEDLAIPVGSQADRSAISLPANGMSQASVRQRWGNPLDIRGPVGQPPISQWHYTDFVVYFERDLVMHTVAKRQKN